MGIMDKFKNLFTEEVEEEIKPIKKEVRQVEIPSPKREIREIREIKADPVATPVSESKSVNKEEKFVFPVYFDDKDFDDLEKPKKEQPIKKETPKVEVYQGPKAQKIERKFEASPIISPVYGILDKNYKKEDISTRQEQPSDYTRKPKSMTVDDIRNKAFGTLEDDLEDTLFGSQSMFKGEEESFITEPQEVGIDIFEELRFDEEAEEPKLPTLENMDYNTHTLEESKVEEDMDEDTIMLARQLEEQKKKLEQINEYINDSATDEVPEPKDSRSQRVQEVVEDPLVDVEKEDAVNPEDLTESELLSLVDAMYEKRDEE